MSVADPLTQAAGALRTIKIAHTVIWAIFATCIVAIPVCAWLDLLRQACVLIAIVLAEVVVLAVNGGRCPLTHMAARHTTDRSPNFDIYLPEWLARHNKIVFGSIYLFGIAVTAMRWAQADWGS